MATTISAPAIAPTRRRFTVAEYYALAKSGILAASERVELLEGDIIVMPPIGDWHATCVDRFTNTLPLRLQGRAIVRVQGPTRLNLRSEPQPDVMLLRWRDDFYRGGHPSPGDVLLLIEVADTSVDYDRGAKLTAYARAGIPEVWIVMRENRRIEAYTGPEGDTYTQTRQAGPGASIAPEAFPDLVLEVNQVVAG